MSKVRFLISVSADLKPIRTGGRNRVRKPINVSVVQSLKFVRLKKLLRPLGRLGDSGKQANPVP